MNNILKKHKSALLKIRNMLDREVRRLSRIRRKKEKRLDVEAVRNAFRNYGYEGATVSQVAGDLGLKDPKSRQALWVWVYYNAKKGKLVRDGKRYRLVDLWEE